MRRNWTPILDEAAAIAASYSTPVTLRQLHYRLVGLHGYTNTQGDYKTLSALTAEARRAGTFPELSDTTRGVDQPVYFDSPEDALDALIEGYRRDRTEGQKHQVWLLYEKATLAAQMSAWTEDYGLPHAALRGYSSESLERAIFKQMVDDGRPVVAFYVGDLDPEGEDIERNFLSQAARMGIEFEVWERLTVSPTQALDWGLPPQPGKEGSSRAAGFIRKYGRLFQIEVEAVDPATLKELVTDALSDWRDEVVLARSRDAERADQVTLIGLRRHLA
jgi:hypothetical protein